MANQKDGNPIEHEAVRTTIVGGRPPGSGKPVGQIPRGIEILVKKAAIDSKFLDILIKERADAASRIGLELDPSEVLMLNAIPDKQLRAIVKNTRVAKKHRTAFMGYAAAAMLATIGIATAGCNTSDTYQPLSKGIDPDTEYLDEEDSEDTEDYPAPTGSRPDLPYIEEGEDAEDNEGEDATEAEDEGEAVNEDDTEDIKPAPMLTRGVRPDLP